MDLTYDLNLKIKREGELVSIYQPLKGLVYYSSEIKSIKNFKKGIKKVKGIKDVSRDKLLDFSKKCFNYLKTHQDNDVVRGEAFMASYLGSSQYFR